LNLRTYRASTIAEALTQVKRDLGADAVILHTRTTKAGGWFGFGARAVVEVTASTGVNIGPARSRRGAQDAPSSRTDADRAAAVAPSRETLRRAYAPSAEQPAAGAPYRGAAPTTFARAASGASEGSGGGVSGGGGGVAAIATCAPFAPADDGARLTLETELTAIKSMVARVLSSSARARTGAMPEALQKHYLTLLEAEVASEIADEVIDGVRADLDAEQLDDPDAVRRAVLRRIAEHIPVADDAPCPDRAEDGRSYTIALVGPTGVGKTTTIAKLAATYKLRHGRAVGLVTADTYRIAAVDQLRTYANIIGLPLKVASTPAEMAAACDSLRDCDVVLVDTAGRSQMDDTRLEELRSFVEAAKPHQTHLVLSSASSESVLLKAAERFACVGPSRVIFTKLDEAVNFGVLVNVARRINTRLSYVTTGQEVPDRIEQGDADRLAGMVLEGRGSA